MFAGAHRLITLARRCKACQNRTHGASGTPTHNVWLGMMQRCTRPGHIAWRNYGGRGIAVCARWMSFEGFLADMGERPNGRTLDRINNDGNYEPGNCRWASRSEQARNRADTRWLEFRGQRKSASTWSEESGIATTTIVRRIDLGWSVERAITTPVRGGARA